MSSLNSIGQTVFESRVRKQKMWTDRQMDKRTDRITPISERNLAMMVIYLLSSLNLTGHSVFDL